MKKFICALSLFSILLTSCNRDKSKENVSVLENENSIINTWFGIGHYDDFGEDQELKQLYQDNPPPIPTPGGLVIQNEISFAKASPPIDYPHHFFAEYLFQEHLLDLNPIALDAIYWDEEE